VLHTLAFDPGSRFLVTGSRDRTARRWNLKAQNPADSSTIVANDGQGVDSSITAVALSDNAQRLVTGDYSGLVRVWNLADGAAPITLRGHRKEIVGAAISSDGQFVVTGSEDSTIRIWNLRPEASGVPIVLREDEQPRFLSLSKDGRFIVSGNDKAIELWQLKVDELMRLARVIAGRNLSHAEWRELFPGKPYVKTFKDLADPTDEEEPPANAAPKPKASSKADPSPH